MARIRCTHELRDPPCQDTSTVIRGSGIRVDRTRRRRTSKHPSASRSASARSGSPRASRWSRASNPGRHECWSRSTSPCGRTTSWPPTSASGRRRRGSARWSRSIPGNNNVAARVRLGGDLEYLGGIAAGYGAVWVGAYDYFRDVARVWRVDPASGRPTDAIRLVGPSRVDWPTALRLGHIRVAVGEGSVWVATRAQGSSVPDRSRDARGHGHHLASGSRGRRGRRRLGLGRGHRLAFDPALTLARCEPSVRKAPERRSSGRRVGKRAARRLRLSLRVVARQPAVERADPRHRRPRAARDRAPRRRPRRCQEDRAA